VVVEAEKVEVEERKLLSCGASLRSKNPLDSAMVVVN